MQIKLDNTSYIYNKGNKFEKRALDQINLEINQGEFIGLIGHTGSGKSTLVQHLNGLMLPTEGKVFIDGKDSSDKRVSKTEIRKKVGLVFQYPEYQLFEDTIYNDIAFGPKNIGCSVEEIEERVRWACEMTGVDFKEAKELSPFELSGGQKRRVAIAGVIAMKPKFLVLDEPTAGLDPIGREEILSEIHRLYKEENITVILISHSMEDVARLADRLLVMDNGRIIMDDKTREVFKRSQELKDIGLNIPQVTEFMNAFQAKGNEVREDIYTVEEAFLEIKNYLRGQRL
ncbi:energy-coupling factor transporter ATPase [Gallicola sp. Sow4_E12]|uniref:energy-coupling factor transporter ATPase n=1 Tax=Gallicola sp. Sow4_E12 TaxID=3438785 RepID=UPI003F92955A